MKLSEVAQIMYNLQEYCRGLCHCSECDFCDDFCEIGCVLRIGSPEDWGITLADIERLKKKEYECK